MTGVSMCLLSLLSPKDTFRSIKVLTAKGFKIKTLLERATFYQACANNGFETLNTNLKTIFRPIVVSFYLI